MKENFDPCLSIILKEEGGNDDDPRDPGGRTSRGIIQREWNVFRQTHPNRPQDVWQASSEDVNLIYHDNYWMPYCDDMPAGVDLVFFNTSVNSGRQQAVKELQRALGVSADGMMGMITWNALSGRNMSQLIINMCNQRRKFYQALKTFPTFGKGWLARTDRIQSSALAMSGAQAGKVIASEHPTPDTKPETPDVTISPKAPTSSADKPAVPPETSGGVTTAGGLIIAALNQLKDEISQFSDIKYITYAVLAITIIGAIYTVYGIMKRNKVQQAIG